jgi:hypothetical protein
MDEQDKRIRAFAITLADKDRRRTENMIRRKGEVALALSSTSQFDPLLKEIHRVILARMLRAVPGSTSTGNQRT